MAERPADERQPDLFGDGARKMRPPARRLQQQERRPGKRADGTEQATGPAGSQAEATLSELAARATPSELDELVCALTDDGLAHLALASVRALRRRLAKPGASRERGRTGRAGALERAARRLAAELGGSASGDDA